MKQVDVRSQLEPIGDLLDLSDVPVDAWGMNIVAVRDEIARSGPYDAIQIVGGDSIVPFAKVQNPVVIAGTDGFDPWILTDDMYGDTDFDGQAEVLVARLPDAGSGSLFRTQMNAAMKGGAGGTSSFVYTTQNSSRTKVGKQVGSMLQTGSNRYTSPPYAYHWYGDKTVPYRSDNEYSFFLLHGSWEDTSLWWGEDKDNPGEQPVAFKADRADSRAVVFSAACYGAWISEHQYQGSSHSAWKTVFSSPPTAKDSIALAFLQKGAECFVGSTGVSYTDPDESHGRNYALAAAFFRSVLKGTDLLQATFDAKASVVAKHDDAISRKLSREYQFYGLVPSIYWKASPSAAASAANTALVIDHSGSMIMPWNSTTKVEGAKSAAGTLVNMLEGATLASQTPVGIGLLDFNENTELLLDPTTDYAAVADAISPIVAEGSTDLVKPIQAAEQQLDAVGGGSMILLTDGVDENGNTDDAIVAAADEARDNGITIFTVGFGTPGSDINEDLLKRIAGDDSRYSYADPSSLVGLAGSFLYSQASASGQVLGTFTGTVQQGETVQAGAFEVASASGDLQTVLYWPGSTLEMKLRDPSGAEVTSGYPGLTVTRTETPAQMFISKPKPGQWTVSVYGAETSMDNEPYYALASFAESTATVTTAAVGVGGGTSDNGAFLLVVLVLGLVGGVGFVAIKKRGEAPSEALPSSPSVAPLTSRFVLLEGDGVPHELKEGLNTVGRSTGSDVFLGDVGVSRQHATIEVAGDSIVVRDLDSTMGTTRNGSPVVQANLKLGDRVGFGRLELVVESASRSGDTGGEEPRW